MLKRSYGERQKGSIEKDAQFQDIGRMGKFGSVKEAIGRDVSLSKA